MTAYRFFILLAVIGLGLTPLTAMAHKESDAYLNLRTSTANGHVIEGRWDIALRDLSFVLPVDANNDGAITWGEVKAQRTVIEHYALSRLTIRGDGISCTTHPKGQKIVDHTDGTYDVILFDAVCDKNIPTKLTIAYHLFDKIDPYHRGIITFQTKDSTAGAVLGPQNPSTRLNLRNPSRWRQFKSFVVDGMWHIWTGLDHLLFILSLLLPAVLICHRKERDGTAVTGGGMHTSVLPHSRYYWEPVSNWWPAFIDILKVVSAFTLSHSFTLSLAVLGIIAIPSRLVESGIALSVILAAGNNLYPLLRQRVWIIAFAFGFIHGLGFASALSGLQLPAGAMAVSLGGFNLGVEIGQEAIVLAVMPLAFLIRGTWFYRTIVFRWGSIVIIIIASLWLYQRAFAVMIPGFSWLLPT